MSSGLRSGTGAVRVVLALAAASCAAAVVILLLPGRPLADREQLSVAVSTVFALLTGIIAITVTARVASSDHQAAEQVKADIARLLAACRSIQTKSVYVAGTARQLAPLDFAHEKEQINDFLSSTTAFAMWAWVGERSAAAGPAPEGWRTFFLTLVEMLATEDPDYWTLADRGAQVEVLVSALSAHDVKRVGKMVEDLPAAVGRFDESRRRDPAIAAFHAIQAERKAAQALYPAKMRYLKAKGVQDPDLDMHLAVVDDDTAALETALAAGANPAVTDGQVVRRHAAELAGFDAAAEPGQDKAPATEQPGPPDAAPPNPPQDPQHGPADDPAGGPPENGSQDPPLTPAP
jgi:hypothetical protein